eukprot:CAMPEP_0174298974 /NCGR_PEP_ID=MMETSP0809-20121228/55383_1 /TAXON_ID=73025 ORGANISM="Eutreptiella gymnastica-like, Strain CCMP1594" /NCGR_SAMPLE_ID=MMETSP0809 /ASSEMBLY_ACC=CAM_ASM_000658 /LENGTH=144 /DNA_ID=CAMNT_0015403841 /DNA_START=22 /DNA_END=453 /DNA_ORIENTATION=+
MLSRVMRGLVRPQCVGTYAAPAGARKITGSRDTSSYAFKTEDGCCLRLAMSSAQASESENGRVQVKLGKLSLSFWDGAKVLNTSPIVFSLRPQQVGDFLVQLKKGEGSMNRATQAASYAMDISTVDEQVLIKMVRSSATEDTTE